MDGLGFTRSAGKAPNRRGPAAALSAALLIAAPAVAAAQVQVQQLAPPDLFSVGASQGELPADLWKGSSGDLARTVIPQLRTGSLGAAAAGLARRVLSASASGPEGAGDDAELAGQRALALLALGDARAVQSIADRSPGLSQKPLLSQAAAEAALILGEEDKACAVGEALAANRDGVYWLRLRAFCQARAGQTAPAQLTLDLADQQERSAEFDRLMSAFLAGKDAGAPALDNGLDFAVSRHSAAEWSKGLGGAAAPVAVAVARDPAAPAQARLEGAARAARLGVVVPEAYAALQPPPLDLPSADLPGLAGEAALAALAASTPDLTLKEAALVELLKRAGDPGAFLALAGLARPHIAQIMGANPVLREPLLFAVAAAAAGDAASARAARAQASQAAPADLAALDALIAAAAPEPPPAGAPPTAALLLGALGAPVDAKARLGLWGADLGPGKASPGRLEALQLSAEAGRMGDVALYALALAMDSPGPVERAAIVRALRQVGLKADARAFALEGLLALQARR